MEIHDMGRSLQSQFGPLAQLMQSVAPDALTALERQTRREDRAIGQLHLSF